MICPSCGNQVADGSPSCPVCGAALMAPGGMPQGGMQPQYQAAPAPQGGGKKTGLIIGIAVAAVAVVALVLCLVLGVFGGGHNGKYVCEDYAAYGMDVSLEVKGSKFTLTMSAFGETETTEGTIKFKGDKVELTAEGDTIEGTYDKGEKSITFEGMTFKKK